MGPLDDIRPLLDTLAGRYGDVRSSPVLHCPEQVCCYTKFRNLGASAEAPRWGWGFVHIVACGETMVAPAGFQDLALLWAVTSAGNHEWSPNIDVYCGARISLVGNLLGLQ